MVWRKGKAGESNPSRVFTGRLGFALIELMVVIAIGVILTTFSLVSFVQIGRGSNLTNTGRDISDLLEQARAYAMAHNTYAWVGFAKSGTDSLLVGVVASRNGNSNPAPADLVRIDRVRSFDRVRVVSLDSSGARPAAESDGQIANLTSAILPFSIEGGRPITFDSQVIQFDSRGECRIAPDQPYRIAELGLQEVVGDQVRNVDNYVAIQIGGLSGAVTFYQR